MKTGALFLVATLTVSSAFVVPAPATGKGRTGVVVRAGGGDEEWRQIVGSEANLRSYLGKSGFRYNLAKTDDEIASEGDFTLWEKIWGGTSNNPARAAARAAFRQTTIDQYDSKKANEGKEWLAKYGYKRWGLPYLDKSAEGDSAATPAAAAKPAAAAAAPSKPAFSFGFPKPSAPAASKPAASAAPKAAGAGRPKIGGGGAPAAAAAPKVNAVAPKPQAAGRTGPLSAAPSTSKVNLNLMKKK